MYGLGLITTIIGTIHAQYKSDLFMQIMCNYGLRQGVKNLTASNGDQAFKRLKIATIPIYNLLNFQNHWEA